MSARLAGDLVEYRTGFRGRWRPGWVQVVERRRVTVEDAYTHERFTIALGKRGKVRDPTGPRMVEILQDLKDRKRPARADASPAAGLPPLAPVIVRTSGAPKAVPAPRPRHRSATYLAWVRTWPCCSCSAPAPSEAHHAGKRGVGQKADDYGAVPLCSGCHRAITDTGALPGRRREETERLILERQVELLISWVAAEAQAAAA